MTRAADAGRTAGGRMLASALAGVGALVVCAGVLASAAVRSAGDAPRVLRLLLEGSPAAAVVALAAAAVAGRAWATVDRLRRDAAGCEALAVRAKLADELAERHRRAAEAASVGVFELLSGIVVAEESARGQLAAELHDTVAQSLMTARALLPPTDAAMADRAADLVAEAEDQLRAVMARTRPPALRDGDLARAVSTLRDDLHHRYGLSVDLHWPAEPQPLPLATAVTVYRFFQEALLNVVKHADVDEAEAELAFVDGAVVATVVDRGPGFDPAQVSSEGGRHVGLGLLRERARLVGGSLELESGAHCGTTLRLRLPRGAAAVPAEAVPPPRLHLVSERAG